MKLYNTTFDEITTIDGVGEIVAESLFAYFGSDENIEMLNKFTRFGVEIQPEKTGEKLDGIHFAITGR